MTYVSSTIIAAIFVEITISCAITRPISKAFSSTPAPSGATLIYVEEWGQLIERSLEAYTREPHRVAA